MNEWELEPEIPTSNVKTQTADGKEEDKTVDKAIECTKKVNGESKIRRQRRSRADKRRSSKKIGTTRSKRESKADMKIAADDSDEDYDAERNEIVLGDGTERKVGDSGKDRKKEDEGKREGDDSHEMVLEPHSDINHQIGNDRTEIERKNMTYDTIKIDVKTSILEYDLMMDKEVWNEVEEGIEFKRNNVVKGDLKVKREEEEEIVEGDALGAEIKILSGEILYEAFQEGLRMGSRTAPVLTLNQSNCNSCSGSSSSSSNSNLRNGLRNDDDRKNDRNSSNDSNNETNDNNGTCRYDDDNDDDSKKNEDDHISNEHTSYLSRMERKKRKNKVTIEQRLPPTTSLHYRLPSLSPLPLVLPVLSNQHLSDLYVQFVNYALLLISEHFLSLSEFEAFTDCIDRKFLLHSIEIPSVK